MLKKILLPLSLVALLQISAHADALQQKNPYDDFEKLNQYFNSLVASQFNKLQLGQISNIAYPRVDIKNNKKFYIVQFDLAGVNKKDIKLSIDDHNILTLEGKKEEHKEDKSQNYLKKEIFVGTFKRMIQLPDDIEQNKLSTEFKNGILTLTIPKKEVKQPKSRLIPIK